MTFFLDNTFPPRSGRILREMGEDAIHLQEVEGFTGATKDVDWMPQVAAKDWIVVSGDGRILTRPHERKLFLSLRLTLFVMHKGYTSLPLWDQVIFLLKCWRDVQKHATKARPGDVFAVKAGGKVERFRP